MAEDRPDWFDLIEAFVVADAPEVAELGEGPLFRGAEDVDRPLSEADRDHLSVLAPLLDSYPEMRTQAGEWPSRRGDASPTAPAGRFDRLGSRRSVPRARAVERGDTARGTMVGAARLFVR